MLTMYNIGLHHLIGPSSTVAVVAVESRSSATAKKKGGKSTDPRSAICDQNRNMFEKHAFFLVTKTSHHRDPLEGITRFVEVRERGLGRGGG